MEEKEFEAFEEDFDAKNASYELWILGYDENESITDYEYEIRSFSDAERAVEFAKEYVSEKRYLKLNYPAEVKYIEVLVETVVDLGDYTENVGNLFTAQLELEEK